MTPRRARALLAASLALVVGVGLAWWLLAGRDGRVDLVGPAVTTSTTSTTTSIPASAPPSTTLLPAALRPPGAAPLPEPGVPVRLRIADLGVDAPAVPVARLPDGQMQIPGANEAGWYSPGPRPGDAFGSAVIAAHIDFDGRPGVFFRLDQLAVGAEVVAVDDRGAEHRYRVTERFQVAKDRLPRAELFRTGGAPVLTLITCGGSFDEADRHYSDNIVVRAVPI